MPSTADDNPYSAPGEHSDDAGSPTKASGYRFRARDTATWLFVSLWGGMLLLTLLFWLISVIMRWARV